MEEYYLITWQSGGDETHFMLIPYNEADFIENARDELSLRTTSMKRVEEILEEIYRLSETAPNLMVQTYVDEEWPFSNILIKKIISIPELGG